MGRRLRSLTPATSLLSVLVTLGTACGKKADGAAPATVPSASSAPSTTAAASSAAPPAAHAASPANARRAATIAAECALPEPGPPKKPGPVDAAFRKQLAAAAQCDPSTIGCEAIEAAVAAAKNAVSSDNKVPSGILAACIEGLDDPSPRVRRGAADCIEGVAYSIPEPRAAIVALLGKLEAQRPEDEDVALHYAAALMRLDAGPAGYTCRVLRLVEKLPKKCPYASDVLRTLYGMGQKANDVGFDYAYERLMSNDGSDANNAAVELIRTATPTTRESVRCERASSVVKAGVREWGQASMILREDGCKHPDVIVATASKELRFLQDGPSEDAIGPSLLDAAFVDDLPSWPEASADQKKAFCDAAGALADRGNTPEAKRFGAKITALCH